MISNDLLVYTLASAIWILTGWIWGHSFGRRAGKREMSEAMQAIAEATANATAQMAKHLHGMGASLNGVTTIQATPEVVAALRKMDVTAFHKLAGDAMPHDMDAEELIGIMHMMRASCDKLTEEERAASKAWLKAHDLNADHVTFRGGGPDEPTIN